MNYYLGIDLGTSALKILLVEEKNGKTVVEKTKKYRLSTPQKGWVEQDPKDWVEAMKAALYELKQEHYPFLQQIKAISVTGQMHGIVPVDCNHQALHPALIWSDQRNDKELEELQALFTPTEWTEKTGNRPNISFSLGKVLWFEKHLPDLAAKVHMYLFPKDYLRLQLTEVLLTDYTDASATNMLDTKTGSWSEAIFAACSLDRIKLPEVADSTSVSGYITKEASRNFHLEKGTPVICGCGDAQAQAVANGITEDGIWQMNIGTSGQVMASMDTPEPEASGRLHLYSHAVRGSWFLVGATLSAGMSFQWLTDNVYQSESGLEEMLQLASQAQAGSGELIFLPYLFGERSPYMDEKAKGTFIGLTYRHTKAEISRAVVEGVLFSLYQSYLLMTEIKDSEPDVIILSGGASQHSLWMETAASIFNKKIATKASRGGAALGAAAIAAIGAGDYSSFKEINEKWKLNNYQKFLMPNEEAHHYYQRLFTVYEKSYHSLREIHHDLHQITIRQRC